jgi:hypothetical protein
VLLSFKFDPLGVLEVNLLQIMAVVCETSPVLMPVEKQGASSSPIKGVRVLRKSQADSSVFVCITP